MGAQIGRCEEHACRGAHLQGRHCLKRVTADELDAAVIRLGDGERLDAGATRSAPSVSARSCTMTADECCRLRTRRRVPQRLAHPHALRGYFMTSESAHANNAR
jgi:hypothetical protein